MSERKDGDDCRFVCPLFARESRYRLHSSDICMAFANIEAAFR